MDQTHIGYTYWQEPRRNTLPAVTYIDAHGGSAATPANDLPPAQTGAGNNNAVAILAAHYTKAVNSNTVRWKKIPGIGREGDGVTSFPVTAAVVNLSSNSPHLEYTFALPDTGTVNLQLFFSPSLNFYNEGGLQYAISVDEEQPQVMVLNKEDNNQRIWGEWVANNAIVKTSQHRLARPGKHTVKYWLLSPGMVLQKLVVDGGGVKPSYLGPPETTKP